MEQETIINEEQRTEPSFHSISDFYNSAWAFLKGKWLNAVLVALAAMGLMYVVLMVYYFIFYLVTAICMVVGFAAIGISDPSSFESSDPNMPGLITFIVAMFVGILFTYALMFLAVIFGIGPINYGRNNAFLISLRNNKEAQFSDIFLAKSNYWGIVKLTGWYYLFITLWSLLLIIPGIIKAYAYSMAYYIRYDNPELSARECLELSSDMMNGHKLDLFVLHLTFILLLIIDIFTCGLGNLFTQPYMNTITAQFYEDVKAEYEYNQSIL